MSGLVPACYLPELAKLAPEVVVIQEEVHDVEDGNLSCPPSFGRRP